jgi:hypothetical protein
MSSRERILSVFHTKQAVCHWETCRRQFPSKNACFIHVKNDHIMKDSTHCGWKDCTTREFATKQNLVNHMHKHIPRVRDICYVCEKGFKWSGDYRKHCKNHTESEIKFNEAASLLLDNLVNEI